MAQLDTEIVTRADRAVAKAASGSSKSASAVTSTFVRSGMSVQEAHKETRMSQILIASCPRLRGQTTVIGNTAFSFDKEGICRKSNEGNVSIDFELLCAKNGVTRLDDDLVVVAPTVPLDVEDAPFEPVTAQDIAPPGAEVHEVAPVVEEAPVAEEVPPADPIVADADPKMKKSKPARR